MENKTNINLHEIIDSKEALARVAISCNWRYIPAWNKLYKREVWSNLRFPKGKLHEDEYVIHDVFYNCNKISIIPNKLLFYVQREGSIMNKITDRNRLHISEAFLNRTYFYLNHNMLKEANIMFCNTLEKYISSTKRENIPANKKLKKDIFVLYKKIKLNEISIKKQIRIFMIIYFEPIIFFIYALRGKEK